MADRVAVRQVDARERPEPAEEGCPVRSHLAPALDDLPDELFALPDHDDVHEGRDRLGVREGAHAPHHDQGVVGRPVRRPERDAGHAEQPERIDEVAFVGDREAHEVEVGEGAARLEGERRGPRAAVLLEVGGVREEDTLAHDVRDLVQVPVDCLEPEV